VDSKKNCSDWRTNRMNDISVFQETENKEHEYTCFVPIYNEKEIENGILYNYK
jgi:hypothetical protein